MASSLVAGAPVAAEDPASGVNPAIICQDPVLGQALAEEGWNVIVGTEFSDQIWGTDAHDLIYGLGSPDIILGWDPNDNNNTDDVGDILCGGNGPDGINGGIGNDAIIGDLGDVGGHADLDQIGRLPADAYNYEQTALEATGLPSPDGDFLVGGSGFDLIVGGNGMDAIYAGEGQDSVTGNNALFDTLARTIISEVDDLVPDYVAGGPDVDVLRHGAGGTALDDELYADMQGTGECPVVSHEIDRYRYLAKLGTRRPYRLVPVNETFPCARVVGEIIPSGPNTPGPKLAADGDYTFKMQGGVTFLVNGFVTLVNAQGEEAEIPDPVSAGLALLPNAVCKDVGEPPVDPSGNGDCAQLHVEFMPRDYGKFPDDLKIGDKVTITGLYVIDDNANHNCEDVIDHPECMLEEGEEEEEEEEEEEGKLRFEIHPAYQVKVRSRAGDPIYNSGQMYAGSPNYWWARTPPAGEIELGKLINTGGRRYYCWNQLGAACAGYNGKVFY